MEHKKTRVLLLDTNSESADLLLRILDFHGIQTATSAEAAETGDFLVQYTANAEAVSTAKPNILFAGSSCTDDMLSAAVPFISDGGVLIFPAPFADCNWETSTFFRKLTYEAPILISSDMMESPIGPVPVSFPTAAIENIIGLQLLAQQFGIMEEPFYESLTEIQ